MVPMWCCGTHLIIRNQLTHTQTLATLVYKDCHFEEYLPYRVYRTIPNSPALPALDLPPHGPGIAVSPWATALLEQQLPHGDPEYSRVSHDVTPWPLLSKTSTPYPACRIQHADPDRPTQTRCYSSMMAVQLLTSTGHFLPGGGFGRNDPLHLDGGRSGRATADRGTTCRSIRMGLFAPIALRVSLKGVAPALPDSYRMGFLGILYKTVWRTALLSGILPSFPRGAAP
ncbi:hypothetical protein CVT26_008310 [Gymnopilus dilepis]|uniref:Uncharacterized protein n=1 Tax=Gymnopilus dilepis TaxID=231916 RepID=A0A409W9R0_9AGAR|nr:hypothetical protein CVT26_008310 [Gymnopilus dilepis]